MTLEDAASHEIGEMLRAAGLSPERVVAWLSGGQNLSGDYKRDAEAFSRHWLMAGELLAELPAKPARSPQEAAASAALLQRGWESRERFNASHIETIYRALTRDFTELKRAEIILSEAAAVLPGLVPAAARLAAENRLPQKDKDGAEIAQGIFLANLLAHPACGQHLCHAMLLPHPETGVYRGRFARDGALELEGASLERQGKATVVTMRNPRFLNAEDETTLDGFEIAIDLATLDPATEVAVLRGGEVEHSKYQGRRLFSAGINLTHLYHGKISYLWYLRRDMGLVNKLFRGVARRDVSPREEDGGTVEKPWIGIVDGFAIGGGCQILLALDYVLAASDAYLTLPARKEGIIPGAANLRLWRFTGDRIARQAILYGRRLDCDSAEGRLICDEIAPPAGLDEALTRIVEGFTSSGVVSAAGNRRAIRVAQEPLDDFRRYMAVYAREQAYCHFSPGLIANLERHWNAQNRAL
jgi:(3,5-dihydroxyphenyl)acetyl-CoA 1,2-dioxygenase